MTEDQAAATGRMWDQLSVFTEASPMGVWQGNMAFEAQRVRHYQLRWARGQFDQRANLAKRLADATSKLNAAPRPAPALAKVA